MLVPEQPNGDLLPARRHEDAPDPVLPTPNTYNPYELSQVAARFFWGEGHLYSSQAARAMS